MGNKKNKIKVTHVTRYAYPHIGGIETVINQINESLSNEEFEKEVLCCSNENKSSFENGVKYSRCKFLFEFAANTISPQFIWKLSQVKTDILHYHMPFIFAVIAHFFARPKCKKIIITYHGGIVGYDKYMKPFWGLYKRFYQLANKIHVLSQTIIDTDTILSDNKNKCNIIPFGINTKVDVEDEDIKQFRKNFSNKKIILCMGRLVKLKGYIYAIKAMQKIEDAVLLIAGDGPQKLEFEKYINDYKLNEKIKLLGNISDESKKGCLFKSCDIFIQPSIRTESFGIVQLEAMRVGKPIINTKLGTGANFVSIEGKTGLTVEPANIEDLTRAIKKLIEDESLRTELGENAQKRVKELFDIEKIREKYSYFYKELIYG